MSRSVAWRRQLTDAASWHQDEALNATIYILREMGPTGFLLKEEGETKKYKVSDSMKQKPKLKGKGEKIT